MNEQIEIASVGDTVHFFGLCRPYAVFTGKVVEVNDRCARIQPNETVNGHDGTLLRFHLARELTNRQNEPHDGYWKDGQREITIETIQNNYRVVPIK